jgi:uncharacterized protein HemY
LSRLLRPVAFLCRALFATCRVFLCVFFLFVVSVFFVVVVVVVVVVVFFGVGVCCGAVGRWVCAPWRSGAAGRRAAISMARGG